MSEQRAFVDTNVLIYSIDKRTPAKRRRARKVLKGFEEQGSAVISTQVVQEFYVSATAKLGIDPLDAKEMIAGILPLETVIVDMSLIKEAIDSHVLNRISFWDALIVVSAQRANCDVLLTEDLNDGQTIRGVRIENPFRDIGRARGRVGERGGLYRTGGSKRKRS
jgi:predicted nucleic acid-binding protein